MSKKRREKEAEIMRRMLDTETAPAKDGGNTPESSGVKKSNKDTDKTRCPKCGYLLTSRTGCPRCGYHGYIPMSEDETRKTKLILYPVLLVIAVLVYLYVKGYIFN